MMNERSLSNPGGAGFRPVPFRTVTRCSKPSCSQVASAVLSYDYAGQKAILTDAVGDVDPHYYALCLRCAEKLTPPRGWVVEDRRVATPLFTLSSSA